MTEQNQNQPAADTAAPAATASQPATCPFDHAGFARRTMLKGAAAGVTGAAVIGGTGFAMTKAAADAEPSSPPRGAARRAPPLHGAPQHGGTTPAQKHPTPPLFQVTPP